MADLTAPLTKDEAAKVLKWVKKLSPVAPLFGLVYTFRGDKPSKIALMLRMDGYTSVRDKDVMKACGRL